MSLPTPAHSTTAHSTSARPSSALQAAIRTLLEAPLLQEGMDGFREVYPWRSEVRAFFARVAGWTVQIGPGVIRLVASSPQPEGGRALGGLLSPRAAALLAWVLWYHEYLGLRLGEVRQFSLSELSEVIAEGSGQTLDFSVFHNRRALLQAVRALEELGVLRVLDGDAEDWESGQAGEAVHVGALLEFTAAAPYLIASPQSQQATPLQRAARALLVGPVLGRAQEPEAFAALESPGGEALIADLQDALGWTLDIHADHALLLREGQLRGLASRWTPGRAVESAAALLLLEAVRREVRAGELVPDAAGRLTLSRSRLYTLLDGVREQHRAHWGERGKLLGVDKLLSSVLALWRFWGGLAAGENEASLTLEPHLARFEAGYEFEEEAPKGRGKRRKKG